jgi:hypothetical protein
VAARLAASQEGLSSISKEVVKIFKLGTEVFFAEKFHIVVFRVNNAMESIAP